MQMAKDVTQRIISTDFDIWLFFHFFGLSRRESRREGPLVLFQFITFGFGVIRKYGN